MHTYRNVCFVGCTCIHLPINVCIHTNFRVLWLNGKRPFPPLTRPTYLDPRLRYFLITSIEISWFIFTFHRTAEATAPLHHCADDATTADLAWRNLSEISNTTCRSFKGRSGMGNPSRLGKVATVKAVIASAVSYLQWRVCKFICLFQI